MLMHPCASRRLAPRDTSQLVQIHSPRHQPVRAQLSKLAMHWQAPWLSSLVNLCASMVFKVRSGTGLTECLTMMLHPCASRRLAPRESSQLVKLHSPRHQPVLAQLSKLTMHWLGPRAKVSGSRPRCQLLALMRPSTLLTLSWLGGKLWALCRILSPMIPIRPFLQESVTTGVFFYSFPGLGCAWLSSSVQAPSLSCPSAAITVGSNGSRFN